MHRIRVYVDNSVFGGVYDEEFAEDSKRFFTKVAAGKYKVLVSDVLLKEISEAPERVQSVLTSLPTDSVEEIPITAEAEELAEEYLRRGVVGRKWLDDAVQIAAATAAGAVLLLSWNFRHIVNFEKIQQFNGVNLASGYRTIDIRSPKEIGYDSQDEEL